MLIRISWRLLNKVLALKTEKICGFIEKLEMPIALKASFLNSLKIPKSGKMAAGTFYTATLSNLFRLVHFNGKLEKHSLEHHHTKHMNQCDELLDTFDHFSSHICIYLPWLWGEVIQTMTSVSANGY